MFLVLRALWELTRYDITNSTRGLRATHSGLRRMQVRVCSSPKPLEQDVVRAVDLAICFYLKRVRCLQRSVVTTRLLRCCGADARLIIGYRPRPFCSHAWVEVGGRVVNDSARYQRLYQVLESV